jgi:hypothetical protein
MIASTRLLLAGAVTVAALGIAGRLGARLADDPGAEPATPITIRA